MLNRNIVAKAITDYIENQWYSDVAWDIEVTSSDSINYIAVLRYTQSGYDIEDYTFSCTISFDDVQDANDEYVEEEDSDRYMYFSALVDVKDTTIPELHPIWSEDFYTFKETVEKVHKFIKMVYSYLPAHANERSNFWGYND